MNPNNFYPPNNIYGPSDLSYNMSQGTDLVNTNNNQQTAYPLTHVYAQNTPYPTTTPYPPNPSPYCQSSTYQPPYIQSSAYNQLPQTTQYEAYNQLSSNPQGAPNNTFYSSQYSSVPYSHANQTLTSTINTQNITSINLSANSSNFHSQTQQYPQFPRVDNTFTASNYCPLTKQYPIAVRNPLMNNQLNNPYPSVAVNQNFIATSSLTSIKSEVFNKPTLVPAIGFNAENDARVLRSSMKGIGTDEKTLIRIICKRTYLQRIAISQAFQNIFNRNLSKDIKSETSSYFRDLLLGLFMEPTEFLAVCAYKSMKGLGTMDRELCDIICTQNNQDMLKIKAHYHKLYSKSLEDDITSDTSGDYRKLLLSLCQAHREPESAIVDYNRAKSDCILLYSAGVGKLGTDESVFIEIMTKKSYSYLRELIKCYKEVYGHDFSDAVESETSGNFCRALKTIVMFTTDPMQFYIYRISKQTCIRELFMRLCVLRAETDLGSIIHKMEEKLKCSIVDYLSFHISGDLSRAILTLLNKKD